jgi:small-conductance mechanosensitive channel
MLTGLGIGGIAVALAAQSTLENFIGSITLYLDPPVRVGEFCSFGDKEGTVEHIGWRATRIRTRERSVLTIPNAEFSKLQIDNRGLRDRILYKTILNLRLETTSEQLNSVLFRIKEILQENKSIDKDPARARLVSIGPYSLDIEIFAYVITTDINEFLKVQEEISIQILHEIEKAGTALAPPASIHYQITEKPKESADNALAQKWTDSG